MTETKPKRRWFSFSLRTLLLWVTMAAISFGFWHEHRSQNDLIRQREFLIVHLNHKIDDMQNELNRVHRNLGYATAQLEKITGK